MSSDLAGRPKLGQSGATRLRVSGTNERIITDRDGEAIQPELDIEGDGDTDARGGTTKR